MGLVRRCQAFMGLETNPGKEAKTSPKLSPSDGCAHAGGQGDLSLPLGLHPPQVTFSGIHNSKHLFFPNSLKKKKKP